MNSSRKDTAESRESPKLSIEMILRKSFCDSLKEYIKNCSLAGARQMCDPDIGKFARLMWTLVFCTALGTICYYLLYIWSDLLTKPLIVSMESSTYPIRSIDFPAVAVCNINRISKKALTRMAIEEYPDIAQNESLKQVERALLNWGRLINYSFNETLRTNKVVLRMNEKYRFNKQKIVEIMKMLAPSCDEMLLKCSWNGNVVDCSAIFSMHRIASRGHCCTFNYRSKKFKTEIKRQKEPGIIYGLNVILDPLIHDYAYPLNAMTGFDILVLDPSHFADPSAGRVTHRICEPDIAVFLELKATKQIATNEVRKYASTTRKCFFQDENTRSYLDEYSYSSCLVFCRIKTIYSLCKCTPYFFATKEMQIGPVCMLENLRCLNKYREKLFYLYPINAQSTTGLETELQNSLWCPDCLPDCELTQYFTKSYEFPIKNLHFPEKDFISDFRRNINTTNKSYLSIYHPLPDATLDRLDVVFYWYEVLSTVGGFSGIIIGFSIISVIEIIYFLSIRFVNNFYVNYQKYH